MPKLRFMLIPAVILILELSSGCYAEEDPYAALNELVSTSKQITVTDCSIKAVADFERYPSRLGLFREAWLNNDFSLDFYNQRQRQVFLFVILKRYAQLITEWLYIYEGATNQTPNECSFKIEVKSADKFGQMRNYPAVSWKFNRHQANKIAWEKIDPRNFQDLAIEYKIAPEMEDWISNEPSMNNTSTSKSEAPAPSCDGEFLRANAIFIRAATYCTKNYMDSPAGYYALAMSKQCAGLDESQLVSKGREAMEELDEVVKRRGKALACHWVDKLEQSVIQSIAK